MITGEKWAFAISSGTVLNVAEMQLKDCMREDVYYVSTVAEIVLCRVR